MPNTISRTIMITAKTMAYSAITGKISAKELREVCEKVTLNSAKYCSIL